METELRDLCPGDIFRYQRIGIFDRQRRAVVDFCRCVEVNEWCIVAVIGYTMSLDDGVVKHRDTAIIGIPRVAMSRVRLIDWPDENPFARLDRIIARVAQEAR